MRMLVFITTLLLITSAWANNKYYGKNATEATLTFSGQILLTDYDHTTLTNARRDSGITEAIDYQLSHLIGHFQSASFLKAYKRAGVLGSQYKIKLTAVENTENGLLVSYDFDGKTNFHAKVFSQGSIAKVPLRMPLDPYSIYQLGMVRNKNKCTDEHYNSEGDFFYFWDPDMTGCPLKGNTTDVLRIEGKLKQLANTTNTYPEYNRLYTPKPLKISVFVGYIDDTTTRVNRQDDGYLSYRAIQENIDALGFTRTQEHESFGNTRTASGLNFETKYSKTLRTVIGEEVTVELELILADSDYGATSTYFRKTFVKALQESQIIAYDGHSGLGGNLAPDVVIPSGELPSFYQIMFFNGCSSYPYYNDNYFALKPGGKKNLEIITSGLPTLSSTSVDNMMAFITPFLKGRVPSYQDLLDSLERSSGRDVDTYLFGVNGDEDNKFQPE